MRPYRYLQIIFIIALLALAAAHVQLYWSLWWVLVPIFIYITLLVLGAIYIQWDFYLKSYNKGSDKRFISLTFDDGPSETTATILDVLKDANVQAAFFTIGKNAASNTHLLERCHAEGHLIGNHSYNHGFNFDWKSASAMVGELQQTNEIIKNITGKMPLLFRPPYGVTNPNVAKAVKRLGMHSIGWSLRSYDTTANDKTALLQKILSKIKGGDIILLHDTKPITAAILKELIAQAQQKGFIFVRVDKLLDIEAYA